MKRFVLLLVIVVLVGAGSYFLSYHRAVASVVTPDGTDAELPWLRNEFALTPAQYAKILSLHEAYQPICADHCNRYVAAHRKMAELLSHQSAWSAEAASAIEQEAHIQSECHASMLKYAYDVAACMSPAQGERYLQMIKLQLIEGDPAGMFAAAR